MRVSERGIPDVRKNGEEKKRKTRRRCVLMGRRGEEERRRTGKSLEWFYRTDFSGSANLRSSFLLLFFSARLQLQLQRLTLRSIQIQILSGRIAFAMAQIPTPPASRPGSEPPDAVKAAPVSDSADLLQSLDALLEKYLDLLDQHQKSQAELASRISSV